VFEGSTSLVMADFKLDFVFPGKRQMRRENLEREGAAVMRVLPVSYYPATMGPVSGRGYILYIRMITGSRRT
jgi:hypothetical protein